MRRSNIRFKVIMAVFLSAPILMMSGQVGTSGPMPQYLFPEFGKSVVLMKNGEKKGSVMNFNTVSEKLVFISEGKYYDLMNPEVIDTVILNNCKFIPMGKAFYETLISGPVSLFIQHKANLVSAGKQVGYGGTSQVASTTNISSIETMGGTFNLTLPPDYVVKPAPVCWIRMNEKYMDFTTEKQFLRLFPEKSDQIKEYIKKNKIRIDKKDHLIKLVRYTTSVL